MNKLIQFILCHNCGTTLERDLSYRACSNCFACKGCEIYTCYECGTEIIVNPKKGPHDSQEYLSNHKA